MLILINNFRIFYMEQNKYFTDLHFIFLHNNKWNKKCIRNVRMLRKYDLGN